MTNLPVLAAGQRRELLLDGVAYTVRALTYAEHSALQLARAAQRGPSNELLNDALRRAAEAAGRPDLAEAITAQEEAEDALSAFYAAAPPTLDDLGRAAWLAEHHDEHARLQRDALRAGRKRRLALDLYGDAEEVQALRRAMADALRAAALDLVAAGLVEIAGKPAPGTRDAVDALPSTHVSQLAEAISAMLSPQADAAKN